MKLKLNIIKIFIEIYIGSLLIFINIVSHFRKNKLCSNLF